MSQYLQSSKFLPLRLRSSINIQLLRPLISAPVLINVTTSTNISKAYYQIIAKKSLIAANSFAFVNKSALITLTPSILFAPYADIVVFYFNSLGDIISKRSRIVFSNQLPNFVSDDSLRKLSTNLFFIYAADTDS